jgi:hypothetical protein
MNLAGSGGPSPTLYSQRSLSSSDKEKEKRHSIPRIDPRSSFLSTIKISPDSVLDEISRSLSRRSIMTEFSIEGKNMKSKEEIFDREKEKKKTKRLRTVKSKKKIKNIKKTEFEKEKTKGDNGNEHDGGIVGKDVEKVVLSNMLDDSSPNSKYLQSRTGTSTYTGMRLLSVIDKKGGEISPVKHKGKRNNNGRDNAGYNGGDGITIRDEDRIEGENESGETDRVMALDREEREKQKEREGEREEKGLKDIEDDAAPHTAAENRLIALDAKLDAVQRGYHSRKSEKQENSAFFPMIFSDDLAFCPFQNLSNFDKHNFQMIDLAKNREKLDVEKGENSDDSDAEKNENVSDEENENDSNPADSSDIAEIIKNRKIAIEKERLDHLYRTSSHDVSASNWTQIIKVQDIDWEKFMQKEGLRKSFALNKEEHEKLLRVCTDMTENSFYHDRIENEKFRLDTENFREKPIPLPFGKVIHGLCEINTPHYYYVSTCCDIHT